MKTLEDLNLMSTSALQQAHLQLTGNKPQANLTKAQLVQRVYDLQQPDPIEPPAAEDPQTQTDADDLLGDADPEETDPAAIAALAAEASNDDSADALSVPAEPDADDLLGSEPTSSGPVLPTKKEFERTDKIANKKDVVEALAHLGLGIVPDMNGITISKGGKLMYIGYAQPLHRIVGAAETFAGVR